MKGLEPGSPISPQCSWHQLFRKLFFLLQQQPEEFCWRPSCCPKPICRGPLGGFRAAADRESIQKHFLILGGDTSVETTIWSGRKPMVRIQRWSVNSEHHCQTEHCFLFHVLRLKGGVSLPSLAITTPAIALLCLKLLSGTSRCSGSSHLALLLYQCDHARCLWHNEPTDGRRGCELVLGLLHLSTKQDLESM